MLSLDRTSIRVRDERGGIVLGWLTKIAIAAALIGLVIFDGLSVGITKISLTDQGETAAREASEIWKSTHDIQQAYDTALGAAHEANTLNDIDPKSFTVDQDGTVHLRISREATTLVLQRIGALEDWASVSQEAEGQFTL
jgi:hypothetical protein